MKMSNSVQLAQTFGNHTFTTEMAAPSMSVSVSECVHHSPYEKMCSSCTSWHLPPKWTKNILHTHTHTLQRHALKKNTKKKHAKSLKKSKNKGMYIMAIMAKKY